MTRTRFLYPLLGLILLLLCLSPLSLSSYYVSLLISILLHTGLAYSWNIISGYTGYLSFGHVAFFGIGAYTVGILVTLDGWAVPWVLAVLVGGLLSVIFAWPLGRIMLRLRGVYFAVGMLAVAQAVRVLSESWSSLTRAGRGIYVTTQYTLFQSYYGLLLVLCMLIGFTLWLNRSPLGLRLMAIREDEDAAETLGIDTVGLKNLAFLISSLFPGVIGGLYAWYIGYIDPASVFSLLFSINMVLISIFGGMGTVWGPLIGGVVLTLISESLWTSFPSYHLMFFGAAIMGVVLFLPEGIVPMLRNLGLFKEERPISRRARDLQKSNGDQQSREDFRFEPAQASGIHLEHLEKSFSGVVAVNRASFHVEQGSITGLIGPNGSGKTTTLNLISGLLPADGGTITYRNHNLRDLSPHRIAALGVGRTFQITRIFPELTVLENLVVVASREAGRRALEKALALIEFVEIDHLMHEEAKNLSYGQRKLLEFSRVLMLEPGLLLLDEPFAGVNPTLTNKLVRHIRELNERGVTFLVIDHEMETMMDLCQTLVVLDQGSVIAEGPPEEIRNNDAVLAAYFGK